METYVFKTIIVPLLLTLDEIMLLIDRLGSAIELSFSEEVSTEGWEQYELAQIKRLLRNKNFTAQEVLRLAMES